jgi:hypothetical protein
MELDKKYIVGWDPMSQEEEEKNFLECNCPDEDPYKCSFAKDCKFEQDWDTSRYCDCPCHNEWDGWDDNDDFRGFH